MLATAPGARLSATIAAFSAALQCRRRGTPVRTSTRRKLCPSIGKLLGKPASLPRLNKAGSSVRPHFPQDGDSTSLTVYENRLYDVYAEVSGKPRGHGTGLLRDVIIADTDEQAMALWRDSGQFSGRAWFEPFGFRRGMQDPKTGKFPTPEEVIAMGYAYVGTVDTVLRAMETQQKRQPVDWVFCYTYNSLVPHPVLMKSIEAFWTKVMPRFR